MVDKNRMVFKINKSTLKKSSLKHLLVTAIALLCVLPQLALTAEMPGRENKMVHRDGNRIVDGDGHPLQLRGVNLGGWLLWEPWMWGGHLLASESKLSSRLESVVGPQEMAKFRQEVYNN